SPPKKAHVDVRDDRHAGNDRRPPVYRYDMPGPSRDLHADEHVVAVLRLVEHVGAGPKARGVTRPDFVDERREGGTAVLKRRGPLAFRFHPGIERLVPGIEDVDLVLTVGFGEKNPEVGVGELEVDGIVGDLD